MKILFFGCAPTQGSGYARVGNKITNYLASIPGVEVVFFAFQMYKNQEITDRFIDSRIKFIDPLILDPDAPLGFGDNIIGSTVKEEKPDALIIYNDMIVVDAVMNKIALEDLPPKKYIYLDIVYPWQSYNIYEKLKKHNFDNIFVFLDYWRDHLINDYKFDPERVTTLPHGIDFQNFVHVPKEEAKVKMGFNSDDFLVINMNRNSTRKNWDITLMAFLEFLKNENMNPRIKLYCGGLTYHSDGYNMMEIIINESYKRGLDIDTVLHKHIFINPKPLHLTDEEVNLMYNASDVGMNTCRGEGFGLTTLEHLYFNRPQIVSGVPALKETLGNYVHFVKPKVILHTLSNERESGEHMICDYKDFANYLQYCFRNPDKYPNSSEYVKQKYSWDNVYKILENFFKTTYT